jgi:hypothetical protein
LAFDWPVTPLFLSSFFFHREWIENSVAYHIVRRTDVEPM